jgi:prepilin-type N-terminal cleavage/methylation domain-containing protein
LKKLNKGFTMIELLIVIAITGVLATAVTPKLIKEIRKATVATVQHKLGVVRSRLSIDETLSEDFPDLANEDGDGNTSLLKIYSIEFTPAFAGEDGVGHGESTRIVTARDNTGGWLYIRNTGEFYANLPDGAYTKDKDYEVWVEEIASTGENDPDKNNSWDNTGFPTLKSKSYFTGAGGQFYKHPDGEYVVDINPNIGWLANFVPNGKLNGNYYVYIDNNLVNSGHKSPTDNGNKINIKSYQQNTGGNSPKNLKVAFEYIEDGKKKIIYGEIPLKKNY